MPFSKGCSLRSSTKGARRRNATPSPTRIPTRPYTGNSSARRNGNMNRTRGRLMIPNNFPRPVSNERLTKVAGARIPRTETPAPISTYIGQAKRKSGITARPKYPNALTMAARTIADFIGDRARKPPNKGAPRPMVSVMRLIPNVANMREMPKSCSVLANNGPNEPKATPTAIFWLRPHIANSFNREVLRRLARSSCLLRARILYETPPYSCAENRIFRDPAIIAKRAAP